MSYLEDFLKDMRRESAGTVEAGVVIPLKKTARAAIRKIVARTPVDTRQTKQSWKVSLNKPNEEDTPSASVIGDADAVISQMKAGDTVWISNNRPHASILENGGFVPPNPGPSRDPRPGRKGKILVKDGYSVQAPQGMVAVTLAELELTEVEQ